VHVILLVLGWLFPSIHPKGWNHGEARPGIPGNKQKGFYTLPAWACASSVMFSVDAQDARSLRASSEDVPGVAG
jgi:hypothetical protein